MNYMKIRLVITMLAMLFTLSSIFAQGDLEKRIQEERVKFFNQELQLSEAEAAAFWPLFDQYRADEKALEAKYRTNKKLALLSDEEVEQHIFQMLELEEQKLALKKDYIEKLRGKLPIRKIAMLKNTELKFKRRILKKIQENRARRRRK